MKSVYIFMRMMPVYDVLAGVAGFGFCIKEQA